MSIPLEPSPIRLLWLTFPFLSGAELARVSAVSKVRADETASDELWRRMVARDFHGKEGTGDPRTAYKKLAEENLRKENSTEEGFCDGCGGSFWRLPWEDAEEMPGVTWCSGMECGGERRGWHEGEDPSMECDGCGGCFCSECTCDYDPGQGYTH